jgi:hypothetical protein
MTRVGKAHWLGAVFPKFCSPENIVIWLYDLRHLFVLHETEPGDERRGFIKSLCPRARSHSIKQAILERR